MSEKLSVIEEELNRIANHAAVHWEEDRERNRLISIYAMDARIGLGRLRAQCDVRLPGRVETKPSSEAWGRAKDVFDRIEGWRPADDWLDYALASILLELLPAGDERATELRFVIADALESMGEFEWGEWGHSE